MNICVNLYVVVLSLYTSYHYLDNQCYIYININISLTYTYSFFIYISLKSLSIGHMKQIFLKL